MVRPTEAEGRKLTTATLCVDRALLVDEDKILNPNYPAETRSVLEFGLARRGIFYPFVPTSWRIWPMARPSSANDSADIVSILDVRRCLAIARI